MTEVLLTVAGLIVIGAVFADACMTTLGVSGGAGPLTSVILGRCWRLLMRFHKKDRESRALASAGVVFVFMALMVWVLALWLGWVLVFAGSDAIVHISTGEPASFAGEIYFTGFAIITLGTGQYDVTSDAWGIITALASFTGFFLVTLSIAYLVSVVTAVVARRALAIQVNGLGESPTSILELGWDGTCFTDHFHQQLTSLTSIVAVSAEQHLAYPVLNYFHSASGDLAGPLAMANLEEALMLLEEVVSPESRPDRSVTRPLRFAIERYLRTAAHTSWTPDVEPPPPPPVERLREIGIPLLGQDALDAALESNEERRVMLHQLVTSDGWSWPDR
ncbi:hypothetical protein EXE58_17480 [Nocardioides seonyuensis]|uniref:Two pore domain potassium channel family protein n=1 Tax=Nocardioides seonyuensis TaxID=2518371 RepID=A0A4P7IKU0_9ACTN|nr:hypothetical protein [Nocardioides seonyuensis]QBX57047.1 hypothetical protein EXE58_17480 [Nocardioides seonyuensis]